MKKIFSLNAKAIDILFYALDKSKFNQVSTCEIIFDIWHIFEVIYEGTNRVKKL